ncbi:MAG TPA: hypothetical protein VJ725_27565 [Thermoanaerobaculia bacterium]|nr:hypothetical protein [Thermoanaerobaculia bacterium]
MRRNRRLAALALLFGAALAFAPQAEAQEAAAVPLVRLLIPEAGAVLRAGSPAELAWEPLEALSRIGKVEEWEAFLSFDGGNTYPFRITPHVDRSLQRIVWRVPEIPTRDARLLLRFGDERREVYSELPWRFTIEPGPQTDNDFLPLGRSLSRGEAARPGDAGVVAWVEGPRRGGSSHEVAAAEPPALEGAFRFPEGHSEPAILSAEEAPTEVDAPLPGKTVPAAPSSGRTAHGHAGTAPPRSIDILLLMKRQNE